MWKTTLHLAVVGAAVLALAGCSARAERRTHEKYHEVFGEAPEGRQLDLNSASRKDLVGLPGITDEEAARIIANRPYGSKRDLLRKGVLGERQYGRIQDYVYVGGARGDRSGETN